jgi:hypothetical protein
MCIEFSTDSPRTRRVLLYQQRVNSIQGHNWGILLMCVESLKLRGGSGTSFGVFTPTLYIHESRPQGTHNGGRCHQNGHQNCSRHHATIGPASSPSSMSDRPTDKQQSSASHTAGRGCEGEAATAKASPAAARAGPPPVAPVATPPDLRVSGSPKGTRARTGPECAEATRAATPGRPMATGRRCLGHKEQPLNGRPDQHASQPTGSLET